MARRASEKRKVSVKSITNHRSAGVRGGGSLSGSASGAIRNYCQMLMFSVKGFKSTVCSFLLFIRHSNVKKYQCRFFN